MSDEPNSPPTAAAKFPEPRKKEVDPYRAAEVPLREPRPLAPPQQVVVRPEGDLDPVQALKRAKAKPRPPRTGWAIAFLAIGVAIAISALALGGLSWMTARAMVLAWVFVVLAVRTYTNPDF